jgi:hypothetical protein
MLNDTKIFTDSCLKHEIVRHSSKTINVSNFFIYFNMLVLIDDNWQNCKFENYKILQSK